MLQIIIGESGQEQNDALVERFDRLVNSLLPPGARFAVNPRPNWDYPAPTREQYLSSFGTFTPTPQFRPGAGTLVSPRPTPPAAAGRPPLPAGGRVDPSFNWREELRQTLDRIINPAPGLATYTQVLRLFSSSQAVLFGQGENVRQVSGGIAEQRPIGGGLDVADFEQVVGRDPRAAAGVLLHELTEQYGIQHDHQDYPTAHRAGLAAESRLRGATRQESLEFQSPRGEVATWRYWVPYGDATAEMTVLRLTIQANNVTACDVGTRLLLPGLITQARTTGLEPLYPDRFQATTGHPWSFYAGGSS